MACSAERKHVAGNRTQRPCSRDRFSKWLQKGKPQMATHHAPPNPKQLHTITRQQQPGLAGPGLKRDNESATCSTQGGPQASADYNRGAVNGDRRLDGRGGVGWRGRPPRERSGSEEAPQAVPNNFMRKAKVEDSRSVGPQTGRSEQRRPILA